MKDLTMISASLCLFGLASRSVHGLAPPLFGVAAQRRGGGRAPLQPDMPQLDLDDLPDKTWLTPCKPSEARLTIVQITDVYTLENFPSLRTLLATIRAVQTCEDGTPGKVISMLTGDFLSPYLLSSVDRGAGMMNALAKTPIDYLTWGNHEADIDHRTVCRHAARFPGTWLNTNMQDHDAMIHQQPYDVIEIESPDGTNKRRVGLVALLSDEPALYAQFKDPGAFGGATIEDPWETLREYKAKLENEERCDTVIPLQHLYVPEDHRTCAEFDVPLVLSGHDHHRVDEMVHGTRLIKPGLDAAYAAVVELTWKTGEQDGNKPFIRSTFVRVEDWDADPQLQEETEKAYEVLAPLRNTELARVPPNFEPLSSCDARGRVTSMGRLICSFLKSAINGSFSRQPGNYIDAVLLMGGNIRGGTDYPEGSFFSMEALEAEIKSDEVVGVVPMPGHILAKAVEETHAGDPIPGWMQYDDGIKEEKVDPAENEGRPTRVTTVAGYPIDPDRIYLVATKIADLTNEQSPTLTEYYTENRVLLPSKGYYTNVQAELMSFFAQNLFRKLWEATFLRVSDEDIEEENCELGDCYPEARFSTLDRDGDGQLTVEDIQVGLRDFLGLSIDKEETVLAEYVHSFADMTDSGKVTVEDFKIFCEEIPQMDENPKWRQAFPKVVPVP